MLPEPTEEQLAIIQEITTCNLIVDAVAGSGKTTTILNAAKYHPDKRFLLITYNKNLKLETQDKIKKLKFTNIICTSYHGAGAMFYHGNTSTDIGLKEAINGPLKFRPNYDIIIMDEAQDMNPLLYEVSCRIYKDNANTKTLTSVFGDFNQCIFADKGADGRYIKFADELFKFNDFPWKRFTLSQSFRLTIPMAEFVNKVMLKQNRIYSRKKGNSVKYYIGDPYNADFIIRIIESYLEKGYKFDDFFILAYSAGSSSSPIINLTNRIKIIHTDWPIYVNRKEQEEPDKEEMLNKLCFTTFHSTKGLERKIVINLGIDQSYYKYYDPENKREECPNLLYVANTRATEELIIIHSHQFRYLNFIASFLIESICDFKIFTNWRIFSKKIDPPKPRQLTLTSVTNFTSHLNYDIIERACSFFSVEQTVEEHDKISIPPLIQTGPGLKENVADLTGSAIPMMYYYQLYNKISSNLKGNMNFFWSELNKEPEEKRGTKYQEYLKNCKIFEESLETWDSILTKEKYETKEFLQLANIYDAIKCKFIYRLFQITNYDWLSDEIITKCFSRLDKFFSKNLTQELPVNNDLLLGSIDYYDADNDIIWELKCTSTIKLEYFLQLAIYGYLYEQNNPKPKGGYYLLNVFTNEVYKIKFETENITQMIEYIKSAKLDHSELSNAEFINVNSAIYCKHNMDNVQTILRQDNFNFDHVIIDDDDSACISAEDEEENQPLLNTDFDSMFD